MSGPLVIVFLRGGADGLSLLAPVEEAAYAARGDLGLAPDQVLQVANGFGLHPALVRLHRRFAEGNVALIPAAGIPALSRSHFDAQFRVESAAGDEGVPEAGGWLGRHLATGQGDDPRPWRGVSFGQVGLPRLLAGSHDTLAATSLSDLRIDAAHRAAPSSPTLTEEYLQLLDRMWESSPDGNLRAAARSGLDAIADASGVEVSEGGDAAAVPGLPDTVAVLGAGLGTEVAVLNIGGWDTHNAQGTIEGTFARLAASLDLAVDTILAASPPSTVLVVSEFGRRVAPNASGGFDHGRGGLAIVAGASVAGGTKGDWPGLDELDEGDVQTVNDLRDVMAEITIGVLEADPQQSVGRTGGTGFGLFR